MGNNRGTRSVQARGVVIQQTALVVLEYVRCVAARPEDKLEKITVPHCRPHVVTAIEQVQMLRLTR